jgi:hypothetical protein
MLTACHSMTLAWLPTVALVLLLALLLVAAAMCGL